MSGWGVIFVNAVLEVSLQITGYLERWKVVGTACGLTTIPLARDIPWEALTFMEWVCIFRHGPLLCCYLRFFLSMLKPYVYTGPYNGNRNMMHLHCLRSFELWCSHCSKVPKWPSMNCFVVSKHTCLNSTTLQVIYVAKYVWHNTLESGSWIHLNPCACVWILWESSSAISSKTQTYRILKKHQHQIFL